MNEATFLSRLLLTSAILTSFVLLLVLPTVLSDSANDEIRLATLRGELDRLALPYPTKIAIFYADNLLLRVPLFVAFLIGGLIGERYIKNKKISGFIYFILLILATLLGQCFLLSLLLPFMPL
jgi:hypothetical protein